MPRYRSRLTQLLYDALADGEKHHMDDLVDSCRHGILPGVAVRVAEKRRRLQRPGTERRVSRQDWRLIDIGVRTLLGERISYLVSAGKVERLGGGWFRWVA